MRRQPVVYNPEHQQTLEIDEKRSNFSLLLEQAGGNPRLRGQIDYAENGCEQNGHRDQDDHYHDRYYEPLTEREYDVLRPMAQGRTNREIAQALNIAPSTVQSHIKHILHKLGAHTRTEAAFIAGKLNLL